MEPSPPAAASPGTTPPQGTGRTATTQARDAIVFIPAIGEATLDKSVDDLAWRIAAELDRDDVDVNFRHIVKVDPLPEPYSYDTLRPNRLTPVRKIVREEIRDDGSLDTTRTSVEIVDVYALDYTRVLTRKYENLNLVLKSLLVSLTLIAMIPRIWGAIFPNILQENARQNWRGKTFLEKVQILYALAVLFLLSAYFIILVSTAVGVAVAAFPQIAAAAQAFGALAWNGLAGLAQRIGFLTTTVGPVEPPLPPRAAEIQATLATWASQTALGVASALIVLASGLEVFKPRLKEAVSKAAVEYLCMIQYLGFGDRRRVIVGQLVDLLIHIQRKGRRTPLRNVHVFAYSFGTIIALDALFPQVRPAGRRFRQIHTLVTIGCPFDLIRTFWWDYFDNRIGGDAPKRWLNVYSPVDFLSSNFRNDGRIGKDAEVCVAPPGPEPASQPQSARGAGGAPGTRSLLGRMISALAGTFVRRPVGDESTIGVGSPAPHVGKALTPNENLVEPGPIHLSFWEAVTLMGLRAHSMYWEKEFESELSCFAAVVPTMADQLGPARLGSPGTSQAQSNGAGRSRRGRRTQDDASSAAAVGGAL